DPEEEALRLPHAGQIVRVASRVLRGRGRHRQEQDDGEERDELHGRTSPAGTIGGSPRAMRSGQTSSSTRTPSRRWYVISVSHGALYISGSVMRNRMCSLPSAATHNRSSSSMSSLCGRPEASMIVSLVRPLETMTSVSSSQCPTG